MYSQRLRAFGASAAALSMARYPYHCKGKHEGWAHLDGLKWSKVTPLKVTPIHVRRQMDWSGLLNAGDTRRMMQVFLKWFFRIEN